jgi:hypothetical protein
MKASLIRRLSMAGMAGMMGLGLVGVAFADHHTDREGKGQRVKAQGKRAHGGPNHAGRRVNMTEEQKALFAQYREQRAAIMASDLADAEKQAQLKSLREQHMSQYRSSMTPEQRQQAQTARARYGDRAQRMARHLNLNEAQKTQVESAALAMQQRVQAIRASDASQDEKRTQLQQARTQFQAEVNEVLTEEQREKMQEMRQNRGPRGDRALRGPRGEGGERGNFRRSGFRQNR